MSIFAKYKKTYGNAFGIMVMIANVFFLLIGVIWFAGTLLFSGVFNYNAFIITIVFIYQLIFHKRLMNLIVGIVALFFSIWFLLQMLELLRSPGAFVKILFAIALFSIASAGVLIFSYSAAHKQQEKLSGGY